MAMRCAPAAIQYQAHPPIFGHRKIVSGAAAPAFLTAPRLFDLRVTYRNFLANSIQIR
jgi:hypothetical protein